MSLPLDEVELILVHCFVVLTVPIPFHHAPRGVGVRAQEQMSNLMGDGISQNGIPGNVCLGSRILDPFHKDRCVDPALMIGHGLAERRAKYAVLGFGSPGNHPDHQAPDKTVLALAGHGKISPAKLYPDRETGAGQNLLGERNHSVQRFGFQIGVIVDLYLDGGGLGCKRFGVPGQGQEEKENGAASV